MPPLTTTSLPHLPPELLLILFTNLSCQHDIVSFALVSKSCYTVYKTHHPTIHPTFPTPLKMQCGCEDMRMLMDVQLRVSHGGELEEGEGSFEAEVACAQRRERMRRANEGRVGVAMGFFERDAWPRLPIRGRFRWNRGRFDSTTARTLSDSERRRFTHAYHRLWIFTYMSETELLATLRANGNLRELVRLLDLSMNWTLPLLDRARLRELGVSYEKWKNVCDVLLLVVEEKQVALWGSDAVHKKEDPASLGLLGLSEGFQHLFDKYPKDMPIIEFGSEPGVIESSSALAF